MENKFFTFLRPFLQKIDSGSFFRQPFRWFYVALAILNLLVPLYLLYASIDMGVFEEGVAGVIKRGFVAVWIVMALAGWVGFQIWWLGSREVAVCSQPGDTFHAIPTTAHFVRTFGRWVGIYTTLVGTGSMALASITMGDEINLLRQLPGLGFLSYNIYVLLLFPVAFGMVYILSTHFFAELLMAFVAKHRDSPPTQA